jgi:hypothetical protein
MEGRCSEDEPWSKGKQAVILHEWKNGRQRERGREGRKQHVAARENTQAFFFRAKELLCYYVHYWPRSVSIGRMSYYFRLAFYMHPRARQLGRLSNGQTPGPCSSKF